jgi:hypothetical protein
MRNKIPSTKITKETKENECFFVSSVEGKIAGLLVWQAYAMKASRSRTMPAIENRDRDSVGRDFLFVRTSRYSNPAI